MPLDDNDYNLFKDIGTALKKELNQLNKTMIAVNNNLFRIAKILDNTNSITCGERQETPSWEDKKNED